MTSLGWVLVALVVTPVVGLVVAALSIVLPPQLRYRWWTLVWKWRVWRAERAVAAQIRALKRGDWSRMAKSLPRLKEASSRMDETMERRKAALRDWQAIEQRYGL